MDSFWSYTMPGSFHYRSQRGKGDSDSILCLRAETYPRLQARHHKKPAQYMAMWPALCASKKGGTFSGLRSLGGSLMLLAKTRLFHGSLALLGSLWRQLSIIRLSNFPVHRLLRLLGPFGVANPDSLWIPRDLPSLDYRLSVVSGFMYAYSAPQHINSYIIYIHTTILYFVLLQV